ncbi:MAG TPA: 2-C-methyl-D-erythritol 4-phosphate cytidylyltransferase [Solirubrobacterales bacterium]|nr:2-C-methyl-D-erythritol 4-phosphate cytidylyltransferase [Solirubrobacterales bacterium]
MTAVIAAAGSGERLGAGGPKAFVPLGGRPMIDWSLDACRACGSVAAVVVAVPAGDAHGLQDVVTVEGGATRGESVAKALSAVDTDLVAIHDAARPLLTPKMLDDLVAVLVADPRADGVIAAAPVTDTVKRVEGDRIAGTLDRSELWGAQTPQVFRTEALRKASRSAHAVTDEATLIEAAGGKVLVHDCGAPNIKVTTPVDLRLAELLLSGR